MTSFCLEGGGGAINAPFYPVDLLIDVATTTIHGPIRMLPFKLQFKYVLKGGVQMGFMGLTFDGYDPRQTRISSNCGCCVKGFIDVVLWVLWAMQFIT